MGGYKGRIFYFSLNLLAVNDIDHCEFDLTLFPLQQKDE